MIIIYRACAYGSALKERPIKDKIELVKFCFRSFKKAFKDVDYELVVLMDKPNQDLRNIFKGEKTETSFYPDFNEGNTKSFHRQLEIALEKKVNFMFVEDDYYFLPHAGKRIVEALEWFDFLTPYDHPDYYKDKVHATGKLTRQIDGQHWQTVKSTTLTFAGRHDALKKEVETIKKYGWADHPMWLDITQRYNLWSPMPTLATHMETPFLSPGISLKTLLNI